jgi:DNA polymerase elongation subunit (family B)
MKGWIIDAYPDYMNNEMTVWLKTTKGRAVKLRDAYTPAFYAATAGENLNSLLNELRNSPLLKEASPEPGKKLLSGAREENLLRVVTRGYAEMGKLASRVAFHGELSRYRLYNVDVNLAQRYLVQKRARPMLLTRVRKKAGTVHYCALEDGEELSYRPPELIKAEIQVVVNKGGSVARASDPLKRAVLRSGGEALVCEGCEEEVLLDLVDHMRRLDPDAVLTKGGDTFLMPYLYHRAMANGLLEEFHLGREPERQVVREGRSYHSYGRIVYRPPSYYLKGRMHLDETRFLLRKGGIAGLIDLSRFSGIPPQRLARMTPGNAVTAIQLRRALENNILVPWKRQGCEYFKTAWSLLQADRGGYIFEPRVGIFEDVVELDFASMYPGIMVRYNISPETVLCRCCREDGEKVPGIGYHVCIKKRGLVPLALKPIIHRRRAYKELMRKSNGKGKDYEARQGVLKWLLITSFGYQGYRNSRFGRIESHEAICAYGRELLLRAKEVAEDRGYEVLHGLVDSLWLRRNGKAGKLEEVCREITASTGIDISLKARYKWIAFLPSRAGVGALNRYYGLQENGEIKVRGVEMRMSSAPKIMVDYQENILRELAQGRNIKEVRAALPGVFRVMRRYVYRLKEGEVNPEDLVFTVTVSREFKDYRVNSFSRIALRQLRREGVDVLPGQAVRYIVTDHRSKRHYKRVRIAEAWQRKEGYDADFYVKRLVKATETLLRPFGCTEKSLLMILCGHEQKSLHEYGEGGGRNG